MRDDDDDDDDGDSDGDDDDERIQAIRDATPRLRFLLFSFSLVPHGESTTKNTCSHVGCTSH